MTAEKMAGIKIDDRQGILAAGLDPQIILKKASSAFFKQVFEDGFFHADIHPGNIFVTPSGQIAMVDFGIMGRLDTKTRAYLSQLLLAFLNRDYSAASNIHFRAGWVPSNQSKKTFAQACRAVAEPIMNKPQNQISMALLLKQLFSISRIFEMKVQPQLLLLQKTMLTAEGTTRLLSPKTNMWGVARSLAKNQPTKKLEKQINVQIYVHKNAPFLDAKNIRKTL